MAKEDKKFLRCGKCGRVRHTCAIGPCMHPAVNREFGKYICMYCCGSCRFHIRLTAREHGISGIKCGYE